MTLRYVLQKDHSRADKMNPTALTKISAQAADFYLDAQKAMSRDGVKGMFDKV